MECIEIVSNPKIGEYYLVRCILLKDNSTWPVFSESHKDTGYGLDIEHYHVDWRFVREEIIPFWREWAIKNDLYGSKNPEHSENFVAKLKEHLVEEMYLPMKYLRDFNLPEDMLFHKLRDAMKDTVMKNKICPHHRTNLTSCKAINGVLTCPQHGLKWNVKTGKLVN